MRLNLDFLPWRRRFPEYKRGLTLQWHITNRCANRCAHCYQDTHDAAGELPFDGLIHVLEQYKLLLGSMGRSGGGAWGHVNVTGGEPFARDDFWRLLEALASCGRLFSFAVLSNGSLIGPATATRLKKLNPRFVQISIDGAKETHDRLRGSGDHDRAVQAVKALHKAGVETMISFTANTDNFREFPAVARLGRQLGVGRVWTDRMVPVGEGSRLLSLDPGQTLEYAAIIADEARKERRSLFRKPRIAVDRGLQFITAGGRPYRCAAGKSLIAIMPDGELYPCRRLPLPVGNVMETPLTRLYYDSELFKALRDPARTGKECGSCAYVRFCAGGSRCMSQAVLGDPFRTDPGCPLAEAGARGEMKFIL